MRISECTLIKQHLDKFNSIIMNLSNIDIKIDNEYQTLIVLYALPCSYVTFVDNLLCGKINI